MEVVWDVRWRPGIGDPTVLGWVTAALLLVSGVLCAAAGRRVLRGSGGSAHAHRIWWGTAALLLVLAANKQLDLQSLVTDVGRIAARGLGWQEHRRTLQGAFWAAGAGLTLAAVAWAAGPVRRSAREHSLLLAGLGATLAFAIVRAAAIEHVGTDVEAALDAAGVLRAAEIGGPAVAGAAAVLRLRRHESGPNPASPSGKTGIPDGDPVS